MTPLLAEIHWRDGSDWIDTPVGPGSTPGSSMFSGSVMGVPGTFSCGGACTAPTRFTDGTVDMRHVRRDDSFWSINTAAWNGVRHARRPERGDCRLRIRLVPHVRLVAAEGCSRHGFRGYRPINTSCTGMSDEPAITADASGTVLSKGPPPTRALRLASTRFPALHDDTYEGGHFTAMATIEADFDADGSADTGQPETTAVKPSAV